jgi:hypothetical protein
MDAGGRLWTRLDGLMVERKGMEFNQRLSIELRYPLSYPQRLALWPRRRKTQLQLRPNTIDVVHHWCIFGHVIFVETPVFEEDIQQLMPDETYSEFQQHLASHPEMGDPGVQEG